jgi:hypothetical protein
VALGVELHNHVRVFARRFVEYLQPAWCTRCGVIETPWHGARCAICERS